MNSRILYDQMIGRATRRADHIGKEVFRIFDAVDIYANLQSVTDMRPVIVDPNITLSGLLHGPRRAEDDEDRAVRARPDRGKVRQLLRHLLARGGDRAWRDRNRRRRLSPPSFAPCRRPTSSSSSPTSRASRRCWRA